MDKGDVLLKKSSEGHWEWRIPDFPVSREEETIWSYGRPLLFHDCCFVISISMLYNMDRIGFSFWREDDGPPRTLSCTFGIKKADGMEEIVWKKETPMLFHPEGKDLVLDDFLKKSDLLKRKSELLPSNTLTITCYLKSCGSYSEESSLCTRLWNLRGCLQHIFWYEKNGDFTLKLKDVKISAHRMILKFRSYVFSRMLHSSTRESHTGEVEIEDGNKESITVVLSYLYSGEPNGLLSRNVCEVYKIAHRYELTELLKLCSEYMQGCLSVNMFCDVIALAKLYEQTDLKEFAKNFFVKNASEIVESGEWKAFKKENPAIVAELLERIIVGKQV